LIHDFCTFENLKVKFAKVQKCKTYVFLLTYIKEQTVIPTSHVFSFSKTLMSKVGKWESGKVCKGTSGKISPHANPNGIA